MHDESEGDPFSQIFENLNTGSSYSGETLSEKTQKSRLSRWLKLQDRKLVRTIMVLQKQERISPEFLFDSINRNPISKEYWNLIKSELETDRTIGFLQTRYRKLVRNQDLNKHEKLFLLENYKKYTIEDFQSFFPGKTKSTLSTLLRELETRNSLETKAEKIIESIPEKGMKTVKVLPTSILSSTMNFSKEMEMDITQLDIFASQGHLETLAPKVLRKMSYTMNQISGEIYSKICALKACLKEDLAKGL